ncbi:ankyrin repeat-containing domain protein [Aspergillus stella-maris]|uniref:ankyrin repeat-containing domain protein n=1 Tax=Aspergillus stella-maris TaxID=1810926 RepID=UPI003CCCBB3D
MANSAELSPASSAAGSEVPDDRTPKLRLVNTLQSQQEGGNQAANVDIIHVVGVDPERRLSLDNIIDNSVSSRRREYVFEPDISGLLLGDLVFDAIQDQATRFLDDLRSSNSENESSSPARIFVAYDLGAAILKKAISLDRTSAKKPRCPGIFYSAVQFIFWGCFQRRKNLQAFDLGLWNYLHAHKEAFLGPLLTPTCVRPLADALVEMTDLFISSGITLRTRILSIYSHEGSKHTDPVFDYFTGTIGIDTEIAVQDDPTSETAPIPGAAKIVCYRKHAWSMDPRWIAIQKMLLPLAFPQHQYNGDSSVSPGRLLESKAFIDWTTARKSPILYIQGRSEDESRLLAEQVALLRHSRLRETQRPDTMVLTFSFSSRDPARATMGRMICTSALQSSTAFSTYAPLLGTFLDFHRLQRGWTVKDMMNLFNLFVADYIGATGLLVLQNVDECDPVSRRAVWDQLHDLAGSSDSFPSVIATSRRRLSLLSDSDKSAAWCLYDHEVEMSKEPPFPKLDSTYIDSLVSRLCAGGYGAEQIRNVLQRNTSMDKGNLEQILRIIQDHTNWPKTATRRAWSAFEPLFNRINPSTSTATVLQWILKSIPERKEALWILQLLIFGHRPMRLCEIAHLLAYYARGKRDDLFSTPLTSQEMGNSLHLLKCHLPGLVDSDRDRVTVRTYVSDFLLNTDSHYLLNEIGQAPHASILEFLLAYLTAPEVCVRLESLYKVYISEYDADPEHLVPSFAAADDDTMSYVVLGFPYHLGKYPQFISQIEPLLRSSDQPLLPWARMYWAMSNTFSRPAPRAADSPLNMLLSGENLDETCRKELERIQISFTPDQDTSSDSNQLDDTGPVASVARAVSIGDEEGALKHTQSILSSITAGGQDIDLHRIKTFTGAAGARSLLSQLLWRAAWLDMDRLAEFLLHKAGVSPDPKDTVSARYPSPLYIASILGNFDVVQCLLKAGANTRVLRDATYGLLYAAASNGHSDIVRAVIAKDPEMLEIAQPETPLHIASVWGHWKVTKMVLELGARPDFIPGDDGWSPLIAASKSGYVTTVYTLLEGKADPNLRGPGNDTNALWYASVCGESVKCVRLLLERGANPNHECLDPPLVAEICSEQDLRQETKIALLETLINNTPPIEIDQVNVSGSTGLMWAATHGDRDVVEWLIAHNANVTLVNNNKVGAIYFAIVNNRIDIARKLLESGAPANDLTGNGDTLLSLAMDISTDLVAVMLAGPADPEVLDDSGSSAINTAAERGKSEVVKLLISKNVNIEHRDQSGWCPIHDASGYSLNADIIRLLAEAGANLKEMTDHGFTPLQLAARNGFIQGVNVLLEFQGRIDLEQRRENRETALFDAVHSGSQECVRRLLQAGADINAQREDGWTPLMVAASHKEPEVLVNLLLSWPDLDIGLTRDRGTALHVACKHLNTGIVTDLLDHGADVNQQGGEIWPTPLMATCMPLYDPKLDSPDEVADRRGENVRKVDQIVRLLVSRGAKIHTVHDTIISNLLCAAMLGSGPITINYLLSEGLSLKDRAGLDRLPIHYAAANGINNLDVALVSDHDFTTEDITGKTALHWAAQFCHPQAVAKILAHAPTGEERLRRLNHTDMDGWTALCWALRGQQTNFLVSYSEPYSAKDTIEILLDAGADVSITCRLGGEEERFTPLELAKLHDVSADIIEMISDKERIDSSAEWHTARLIRPYTCSDYGCDVCLNTIWGPVYKCESCSDFVVCKKCFGRIDLYHGHLKQGNGEPHVFRLHVEAEPEIREPSEPGTNREDTGATGGSEGNGSDAESHHEGDTVVIDDTMEAIINFSIDEDFGSPDGSPGNSP